MTQFPHEILHSDLNAAVEKSGLSPAQLGRAWGAGIDADPRVCERKWRRWQKALPPSVVHLAELLDALDLKLVIVRRGKK